MTLGGQIGLAVVAVVAVIAGITFVSQYQDRPPERPPIPDDTGIVKVGIPYPLEFPVQMWEWEPPSAGEFEIQTPGHHDYWFSNPHDVTVDLGIILKSCKCSSIYVCTLTPEEAKRFQAWSLGTAIYQMGFLTKWGQDLATAQQGLWGSMDQANVDTQPSDGMRGVKLNWTRLQNDRDGVSVPPKGSGLVRLIWDGKKEKVGDERLALQLWSQPPTGGPRETVKLEFPLKFVQALQTSAVQVTLEDLGPKEETSREFECWSSTRAHFPLQVKEFRGDPCVQCSVQPMSDAEVRAFAIKGKTRVLSGYRVRVSVKERISDSVQLDLGPFGRTINLDPGAVANVLPIKVTGVVRGDITVGAEEDNGRILLGSFPARNGFSKTITVTADVPGVELNLNDVRVEPETLDYLKASLKKAPESAGGKARWKLQVSIPPGSPPGRLPEHSAIVLGIPGNPPRHIRVPVSGIPYQ
jgi:hypothetical protein